jgi:hypothetical protein
MNNNTSESDIIPDGIINKEKYDKSQFKILWILKEPNSNKNGWSYQEYLSINEIETKRGSNIDTLTYKIFQKILYSSYGILNSYPNYSTMPSITEKKVYEVGEQIAFINIKKTIGGSASKYGEIVKAYSANKNSILNQISEYNPNIIIFGNTLHFFDQNDLKKIEWDLSKASRYAGTKNTTFYHLSSEKMVINAYHPAYWVISNDVYCSEIVAGVEYWQKQFSSIK